MKNITCASFIILSSIFFGCPEPQDFGTDKASEITLLEIAFRNYGQIEFKHDDVFTRLNIYTPFSSTDGIVYDATAIYDPSLDGSPSFTILIHNPHVGSYDETSTDIEIRYYYGVPYFRMAPTSPFTLEIQRWDSRAVGIFSGTLEHRFDPSSTVTISEGTFDIRIK